MGLSSFLDHVAPLGVVPFGILRPALSRGGMFNTTALHGRAVFSGFRQAKIRFDASAVGTAAAKIFQSTGKSLRTSSLTVAVLKTTIALDATPIVLQWIVPSADTSGMSPMNN
jgi:hypothetical protein